MHEKTGGNPFFAIQFISSLGEEALLTFDHDAVRWSWDLGRIRAKGYADNVADLRNGRWEIRHGGNVVARISERWTMFSKKYDLDLSSAQGMIHPHFAMACTILCLNRESAREAR